MRKTGAHNFPAIDRVIYGKAAAEALSEEAERLGAQRVFLIASRTLNSQTDEIEKIRRILGDRHAATFDGLVLEAKSILDDKLGRANDHSIKLVSTGNYPKGMYGGLTFRRLKRR